MRENASTGLPTLSGLESYVTFAALRTWRAYRILRLLAYISDISASTKPARMPVVIVESMSEDTVKTIPIMASRTFHTRTPVTCNSNKHMRRLSGDFIAIRATKMEEIARRMSS